MNSNFMNWFEPYTLFFMVMSLVLNCLVSYLWHTKAYKKLGLKSYKAVQRIHLNETPRLGGFIFLISLACLVAYSNNSESISLLKLILISLLPIFFIGLKEDLFHNVNPGMRMLSVIFTGWLFIIRFTGQLPNLIEVPILNRLLLLQSGIIFFYILGILVIANGMNLLDGVNGLCSATTLSVLGAFLYLSFKANDFVITSLIVTLILTLIPFTFLNYPMEKSF